MERSSENETCYQGTSEKERFSLAKEVTAGLNGDKMDQVGELENIPATRTAYTMARDDRRVREEETDA